MSTTRRDDAHTAIEGSSDSSETESRSRQDVAPIQTTSKQKKQPLNKENVSHQTATTTPITPSREPQAAGRGLSNRAEFPLPSIRTPSSRLQKLNLTPKQRPHLETGALRLVPKTPKRMLATGAVRVEPRKPKTVEKKPPPRRVGYDGTANTPSRELLKSTASSRSHQIIHHHHGRSPPTPPPEELDGSLDSSLLVTTSPTLSSTQATREDSRRGCENPVAMTLLHNNGTEDLDELLDRDVSSPLSSPVVLSSPLDDFLPAASSEDDECGSPDDSTVVSCPSILKVSSSLLDVMDESDLETLAKPVPFRACRSTP